MKTTITMDQSNIEKLTRLRYRLFSLRYALFWIVLMAAILYGIHRYFEYRTQELDKRIELMTK